MKKSLLARLTRIVSGVVKRVVLGSDDPFGGVKAGIKLEGRTLVSSDPDGLYESASYKEAQRRGTSGLSREYRPLHHSESQSPVSVVWSVQCKNILNKNGKSCNIELPNDFLKCVGWAGDEILELKFSRSGAVTLSKAGRRY